MATEKTSTVRVKSSRERRRATRTSTHGTIFAPATSTMVTSSASFTKATPSVHQKVPALGAASAAPVDQRLGSQHRDEHEQDHRENVLDDQPAHRDVSLPGVQHVGVHQHPHQDDGAGHGHGHADDHARSSAACRTPRKTTIANTVAMRLWPDRSGDRDVFHRDEVLQVEMESHPEHQQDDARPRQAGWRCCTSPTNPGVCGPMITPASR